MASKFITLIGLLALSSTCLAGGGHDFFTKKFNDLRLARLAVAVPVAKGIAAGPIAYAAPVIKAGEIDPHPQYDFAYDVHDSSTGDIKNQVETRDGGNVAGSYSLVDADGYKRTVTYTADDINGFNAIVQRDPIVAPAVFGVAAPVLAKSTGIVESSPLVQASPTPAAAAPVPLLQTPSFAKTYGAAPVLHHAAPIIHSTPTVRAYAAAPVVHAVPVYKSFDSYSASVPIPQIHRLPVQQELTYISSPRVPVTVQQQSPQVATHEVAQVQREEDHQQTANSPQADTEPTPVKYPGQEQQEEEQQDAQIQHEPDQQQQFLQEQQQLFAAQQQQFAAQQQQVILQQQQLVEQQQQYFQQQQQQFVNNQQQLSLYPQYEVGQNQLATPEQHNNHDSEVVEGRSGKLEQQPRNEKNATKKPNKHTFLAPVNEEQRESNERDFAKSA